MGRDAVTTDSAGIGDALPLLVLRDVDGAERSLAPWQGRRLLINFWATWCGPCVQEMPALDAFHRQQSDDGVVVIGIALDDPEAVRGFVARTGVTYPILLDEPGPGDASVRLGNARSVLPFSVVVGADGRIVATHYGAMDAAGIARLAQAPST